MAGEESHTLTSNEMPAHVHNVTVNSTRSQMKANSTPGAVQVPVAGSSLSARSNSTEGLKTFANVTPDTVINTGVSQLSLTNSVLGGSQPHENMQQFQALNYIVCLEGVFPSRP
jgi:microcystin-dependent protein